MTIIMIMPCYKGGKFNNDSGLLLGWQVDNDKFNNKHKDKVCLLLKKWD